jgi:hypothetical protein
MENYHFGYIKTFSKQHFLINKGHGQPFFNWGFFSKTRYLNLKF